ncbi:MAG: RNA polymerase sigma-70 factor [Terriglobales bacterium]|jgi:RNA polymerase sigma-70 factor (ECF subfamily)
MQTDDDLPPSGTEPRPDSEDRLTAFSRYRGLLFSIAYRMIGSVADAEDLLQDTFIRWQEASDTDIRSPKAFLITIVSRLCINRLQSARVQREEYVGEWLPEPLATDPGSDPLGVLRLDESLSMAFLVMLERLTPVERAVFLLREVFDYKYAEIASALGLSEANARQILRRAQQHVRAVRPRFRSSVREHDDLLDGFRRAAGSGDMGRLLTLLSSDVVLHSDGGGNATAVPNLVYGADRVARAILGGLRKLIPTNLVQRIMQINGAAGVVNYYPNGHPHSVLTLDATAGRIRAIYIVTNPEKLAHLPVVTA